MKRKITLLQRINILLTSHHGILQNITWDEDQYATLINKTTSTALPDYVLLLADDAFEIQYKIRIEISNEYKKKMCKWILEYLISEGLPVSVVRI